MTKRMHVAIVGSGICGLFMAYRLLKEGYRVSIFEKEHDLSSSTSMAAGGLLTPAIEAMQSSDPHIYALGDRSMALWQSYWGDMGVAAQNHLGGHLLVFAQADKAAMDTVSRRLMKYGVTGQMWGHTQCKQFAPYLGKDGCGFFVPEQGFITPKTILDQLIKSYEDLSGQSIQWGVTANLERDHLMIEGSTFSCDYIIDARGLLAGSDLDHGCAELRAVRGEALLLTQGDSISRTFAKGAIQIWHPHHPVYVIPRDDGLYIGATAVETSDQSPIQVRSLMKLMQAALYFFPDLMGFSVAKTIVGLRPATIDHKPKVAFNGRRMTIYGLYRHGFLLAPGVAELAVGLLRGHDASDEWRGLLL